VQWTSTPARTCQESRFPSFVHPCSWQWKRNPLIASHLLAFVRKHSCKWNPIPSHACTVASQLISTTGWLAWPVCPSLRMYPRQPFGQVTTILLFFTLHITASRACVCLLCKTGSLVAAGATGPVPRPTVVPTARCAASYAFSSSVLCVYTAAGWSGCMQAQALCPSSLLALQGPTATPL
jgi:hypothetical protein